MHGNRLAEMRPDWLRAFSSRDHLPCRLPQPSMPRGRPGRALYDKLEDRVLARDQVGASACYYDLVRSGRPLTEMLREAVRIHGPYTHVPYHERIDNGFVNFVNNDHCLLSARATLHLSKWLPAEAVGLPMAQTIWYIPTGLDIWNQKINKAPGHYARGMRGQGGTPANPPTPIVHWPTRSRSVSTGRCATASTTG
jgi:hypothetical protein